MKTIKLVHNQFLGQSTYDPGCLLDYLVEQFGVTNDAGLAIMLGLSQPQISKLRHHKQSVSASILIRMHMVTGIPVPTLLSLMGASLDVPPRVQRVNSAMATIVKTA